MEPTLSHIIENGFESIEGKKLRLTRDEEDICHYLVGHIDLMRWAPMEGSAVRWPCFLSDRMFFSDELSGGVSFRNEAVPKGQKEVVFILQGLKPSMGSSAKRLKFERRQLVDESSLLDYETGTPGTSYVDMVKKGLEKEGSLYDRSVVLSYLIWKQGTLELEKIKAETDKARARGEMIMEDALEDKSEPVYMRSSVTIPDNSDITIRPGDTIRLYSPRLYYTACGLDEYPNVCEGTVTTIYDKFDEDTKKCRGLLSWDAGGSIGTVMLPGDSLVQVPGKTVQFCWFETFNLITGKFVLKPGVNHRGQFFLDTVKSLEKEYVETMAGGRSADDAIEVEVEED